MPFFPAISRTPFRRGRKPVTQFLFKYVYNITMRKLLLILLLTLLAAGCDQPTQTQDYKSDHASSNQVGTVIDPVSIQGLSQHKFDGRDLKLGPVQDETDTYTRYYITYMSGDLTISGIMNVPKGTGPFPVAILNHGYIDPAVYTNGRGLRREQDYFASHGWIVIHSDYRNHAQSSNDNNVDSRIRLGYVEDVINAIYALKAANLPYADTNRIAMLGHSMGGGIAKVVMVAQPDLVDAYMLYAPVSSYAPDNYYRWTETRPETAEKVRSAHGDPQANPEFWKNVSAVTFFDNVKSPIMINHGIDDKDVPIEWSQRTYDALRDKGKNVVFHQYPGEAHEFGPEWETVMQRTLDFFNDNVK